MKDAKSLTQDMGGRWYHSYGSAPCPVCQPQRRNNQNALTLKDGVGGRLLAHCKKSYCDFADILAAAGIVAGNYTAPNTVEIARREFERQVDAVRRAHQAQRCWNEAVPIEGTIADQYLRGRGITCDLPDTLRFHPACWHGPTASRHPSLMALVEGAEGFGVHRTYLLPSGSEKATLVPNKMMLGNAAGGSVRLIEAKGSGLAVAEGIETALSLACGLLRKPATIWAALSTSGLRGLHLPRTPSRLTIASDGDSAGRDAAHVLAGRAHAAGWSVSLLPAPNGRDWNDILTMKGERK